MKRTALYQAIDSKLGTIPDKPIYCSSDEARLGYGYYFWDTVIASAHWWGKKHYKGNYIICRSYYDPHSDKYLDLVGDLEHRGLLQEANRSLLKREQSKYSIAEVLELLKKKLPRFEEQFWAVRAEPREKYQDNKLDISFSSKDDRMTISCRTRVQMCVTNLEFLLEEEGCIYKVVYPEFQDEGYAV